MNQIPNEQPQEAERLQTVWRTESFLRNLEEAVRYHPVVMESLPDIIELDGEIGEWADKILDDTMADPQKRERIIGAKTNLDGKIVMDEKEQIGDSVSAIYDSEFKGRMLDNDPRYLYREFPVLMMHTHGIMDLPASPKDFTSLINNPDNGELVSIVLTKTTKMIFIRTLQTPEIDSDLEVQELMADRERQLGTEVNLAINGDYGAFHNTWTNKNMKFVLDMCRDYKIGAYLSTEGHRYKKINI